MANEEVKDKEDELEEGSLPLCYDDRHSTAFNYLDRYFFISYSHSDKNKVYADLRRLYDCGLNFWYDKKLHVGDDWDKSVEEKINSDLCVGVLLFVSVESIKSEAVEQELILYSRIREEREKVGKKFKLIPITITGESVYQAVREAFLSCADFDEKELFRTLPQERVKTILNVIPDKMLYIGRRADGSHLAKLVDELKNFERDTDGRLFCGSEEVQTQFDRLPNTEVTGNCRMMWLGEYPQDYDENAPDYFREGVHKITDGTLTVLRDGRSFRHSPLKWQILRFGEDKLTAVTEKVIDVCRADEIELLLENFHKTVFKDPTIACDLRIVGFDLMQEFEDAFKKWSVTDYAGRTNAFSFVPLYWSISSGKTVPFYFDSGLKAVNNAARDVSAGIRLVADFDIKVLLDYIEKEN